MKVKKKNYAYVDGSFNPEKRVYGCGGFLIDQYGEKHIIQASRKDPGMIKLRNVAGEILGARLAASMARALGMDKLKIYYDYEGVEHWVTGFWRCRKQETLDYRDFMRLLINEGLDILFEHVRGHAGIHENEEADRLAKEAVGIFKKEVQK